MKREVLERANNLNREITNLEFQCGHISRALDAETSHYSFVPAEALTAFKAAIQANVEAKIVALQAEFDAL